MSLLRCCGLAPKPDADSADPVSVIVPAYIWPETGIYSQLAAAGASAIVIITGDASGPPQPGHIHTALYAETFKQLSDGGVRLVGYVHMQYGQRLLQETLQAVEEWYAGYGGVLSGIFVDEANNEATRESLRYFSVLRDAVKAHGDSQLLVLNPGTATDIRLAQLADVVLTFEESWQTWLKEPANSRRGRPGTKGSSAAAAAKTAAVVHGTGALSAKAVHKQLQRARQLGYSYAYFTDSSMPDPWSRLPEYWLDEVAAFQQQHHK